MATALRRALDEGVEVRQLAGCGMWVATSSSQAGTAYEVTPWECECHAGQFGDPVCKHRAALRERLGSLRLDTEPEPPTPAAPAAPPVCAACEDKRWVCKHNLYGAGYFRGPCPACVPSAFPLRPAARGAAGGEAGRYHEKDGDIFRNTFRMPGVRQHALGRRRARLAGVPAV